MSYSATETTLRRAFGTPTSYGTVVAPATGQISAQEIGAEGSYRGIRLSLSNVQVNITNSAGAGFATLDLWTFVAGSLVVQNASTDVSLVAAAGIPATSANVVASLGTAATADTTLNGAEAAFVASTAIPALVASTGLFRAGVNTTAANTGGVVAQTLRLNVAVTSGMTSNSSVTLNGTIDVYFTLARAFA